MTKLLTSQEIIEKESPNYEYQNITAFLGESDSGKTVVASLFNYHLTNEWMPSHNDVWTAANVQGNDFFMGLVSDMEEGKFPDSTASEEFPQLIVEIFNMVNAVSKFELKLFDMNGETYVDLLHKEELDEEKRFCEIYDQGGVHLLFANHYVIMIGCDVIKKWKTDTAKVGHIIRSIYHIKKKIHKLGEKKMNVPISIVFTKSDLLDDETLKETANDLLKKYPSLQNQLIGLHDERYLKCFKLYVKSKEETSEEANIRIKEIENNKMNEYQQKLRYQTSLYNKLVDAEVRQAVKLLAEKEEKEIDQQLIEKTKENVRKQAELKHKNVLDIEKPIIKKLHPGSRVTSPLDYSSQEYSDLISWILQPKIN